MPPPKRACSPISSPRKRSKQAATPEDDDEDSLESILAQIKAQEESEALAKQLHDEWNAPGPSSSRASKGRRAARAARGHNDVAVDVIEISDDDDKPEDDEAMAHRLAREWESDGIAVLEPSASTSQSVPRATRTQNSITSSDVPYNSKLEQHRDLFTGEKTCSCGAKLASPRGHVVFSQQKSPQPSLLRLLHAPCKSCSTNYCRGCMTPVSCPLSCKGKDDNSDCPVETCCANVRIIAIFEALGGFDKIYLGERETSDQRAREAVAKARKHQVGSVGPGGTGYGMGGGHGHFGHAYSHFAPRRGRSGGRGKAAAAGTGEQSIRDAHSSHFDEIVARALNTITGYLPAPYSDDPQIYDMLPHESIDALLFLSQLPDLLGNLLRNDSITDWIARIDVYHAMLALLRRMADCELTLEVLIGPRWEVSKSCGLEEWMWNDGNITWVRDSDTNAPVSAPPLYAHFKKLTKQCETFLAGASSMLEDGADEDGGEAAETAVKATSLCGDIMAARDDIERAMTVMGKDPAAILHGPDLPSSANPSGSGSGEGSPSACNGNGKGKARDPAIDLERVYGRECERLAFQYATLSQPAKNGSGLDYPGFNYAAELKRTANATRKPKDRLHLVKELAVMATSLPPGVWVRVDEVRNDAIKIMIAGPEGTPYAGGLFEFDCFIPLEYPNKPPLMHLRTTGGGSVRFNPNLYNNGKVCLSLLGTWHGRPEEQWSPKSTLLQVLVSIQSMILIEMPYFNEPGYGKADPKNPRSIAYNKNICMQTTRWAIVDWLKDENKDGVWAEVIASHFLTREVVIRKCIEDWAKTQHDIRKYRSHALHARHGLHHGEVLMMPPMEWPPPSALGNAAAFAYPSSASLNVPEPPLEPPVLQASAGAGPQVQGGPLPAADIVAPANGEDDWDDFPMDFDDDLDDVELADDADFLDIGHLAAPSSMDLEMFMLPHGPLFGGPPHAPMLGGPPHMHPLNVPLYSPALPAGGPAHMPAFGYPPHAHPHPHSHITQSMIAHLADGANPRNGAASNVPTMDLLEEFNKGIETVRKWRFSGEAEAEAD